MTQQRERLINAAMGAALLGALTAGCAVGLAASAGADDNCDPVMLSMTPQPVLACQAPDVAPPPNQPPAANPAGEAMVPLPPGAP